eukprot:Rmarinus@m.12622
MSQRHSQISEILSQRRSQQRCEVCHGTSFTDNVCDTCFTYSQVVEEEVVADDMGMFLESKTKRKVIKSKTLKAIDEDAVDEVSSSELREALQLILLAQTKTLIRDFGCPQALHETVGRLWFRYLDTYAQFFSLSTTRPRRSKKKKMENGENGVPDSQDPGNDAPTLSFSLFPDEEPESVKDALSEFAVNSKGWVWKFKAAMNPDARFSTVWVRFGPRILHTLAVLAVGCLDLSVPLSLSQIVRLANTGKLPYTDYFPHLPPRFKWLRDGLLGNPLFSFEPVSVTSLRETVEVLTLHILRLPHLLVRTRGIVKFREARPFGKLSYIAIPNQLMFPTPDPFSLSRRFLSDLRLPLIPFEDIVKKMMIQRVQLPDQGIFQKAFSKSLSIWRDLESGASAAVPKYLASEFPRQLPHSVLSYSEAEIMAFIIIAAKLLYRELHDDSVRPTKTLQQWPNPTPVSLRPLPHVSELWEMSDSQIREHIQLWGTHVTQGGKWGKQKRKNVSEEREITYRADLIGVNQVRRSAKPIVSLLDQVAETTSCSRQARNIQEEPVSPDPSLSVGTRQPDAFEAACDRFQTADTLSQQTAVPSPGPSNSPLGSMERPPSPTLSVASPSAQNMAIESQRCSISSLDMPPSIPVSCPKSPILSTLAPVLDLTSGSPHAPISTVETHLRSKESTTMPGNIFVDKYMRYHPDSMIAKKTYYKRFHRNYALFLQRCSEVADVDAHTLHVFVITLEADLFGPIPWHPPGSGHHSASSSSSSSEAETAVAHSRSKKGRKQEFSWPVAVKRRKKDNGVEEVGGVDSVRPVRRGGKRGRQRGES